MTRRLDWRLIARSFDRAARRYDQYAVLQKTVAQRLLDRLDLIKIEPALILDVGSGTGTTARALATRYRSAQMIQVDLSRLMLQESRSRSRRFFSRQHYLCANTEELPIKTGSIDLIFSNLTYQWCNDLDRVFVEAGRVLRPDRLILFATLGPDTLRELRKSWAAVDDQVHVNTFFDMHDVGDALVRAGLEGVVMDVEMITMNYASCQDLMRDIKAVGAHNVNLNRAKGLTGGGKLRRMIAAYEEHRTRNGLPATYEVVYGHAWMPARARTTAQGRVTYIPVHAVRKKK